MLESDPDATMLLPFVAMAPLGKLNAGTGPTGALEPTNIGAKEAVTYPRTTFCREKDTLGTKLGPTFPVKVKFDPEIEVFKVDIFDVETMTGDDDAFENENIQVKR